MAGGPIGFYPYSFRIFAVQLPVAGRYVVAGLQRCIQRLIPRTFFGVYCLCYFLCIAGAGVLCCPGLYIPHIVRLDVSSFYIAIGLAGLCPVVAWWSGPPAPVVYLSTLFLLRPLALCFCSGFQLGCHYTLSAISLVCICLFWYSSLAILCRSCSWQPQAGAPLLLLGLPPHSPLCWRG